MIEFIRERFLTLRYTYTDSISHQRAQALLLMNAVLTAAWSFFTLAFVILPLLRGNLPILSIIVSVTAPIVFYVIYNNVENGRLRVSVFILISLLIAGASITTVFTNDLFSSFYLALPLVAAGILVNRRTFIVVCIILFAALVLRNFTFGQENTAIRFIPSLHAVQEFNIVALILGITSVFLYAFSGSAERVSKAAFRDVEHLKAFNKFNADAAGSDIDQIAFYAIRILQNDLGYNLAQIYFADETGMITRRIRSGGLIDTRFNSRLDDLPVIGETVRQKLPLSFTRDASTILEYPLAPARTGIGVPILYLGMPLGILDVQSRDTIPPTQDQLDGFITFADQIARAIMNVRKLADLQRTVEGQEDVIASFRTRLSELQQRSSNVISGSWTRYLEGRGKNIIGFDLETPEGKAVAKIATDLPPQIQSTIARGEIHIEVVNDEQIVNVPILLRDEPLGAMTFTVPSTRIINERQLEALRTVANRLGQALENNRLFEQTQAQARRERKANEVGAELISATNVESLLELAAQSFNDALGAVYTRIHIDPLVMTEQPATAQNGGGHLNGANGKHNGHVDQNASNEGKID